VDQAGEEDIEADDDDDGDDYEDIEMDAANEAQATDASGEEIDLEEAQLEGRSTQIMQWYQHNQQQMQQLQCNIHLL